MSEAKFTKGEWQATKHLYNGSFEVVNVHSGERIAYLNQGEHNANLIAEAPEMYNTLQLFCDIANGKTEFSLDEIDIKEIENLLAKARGEK